ncbi:hypothetical protein [Phreatobacter sp.]|uniref:COG3904 family protein n=1 Tax=Phreatobacter sp. TaxID=1966341 RepID=UPI0022C1454E|nr:hypothetical protein [Phreatobacter sp.]MCZ8315191.1 hypothetical protein [Phreatobacter sp.]
MRRGLRLALLLLVAAAARPAGAQHIPAPPSAESVLPTAPANVPAMTFSLVTGEAGACGPGCDRWIAAEGVIVADTPIAFFEFAKRLDGARPPLLIQSEGGVVEAAMALGRQVRRAGLTTMVARTDRAGALPAPALDGQCHGACLYLLMGGTERAMAPGAELSISPIAFDGPAGEPFPEAMRQRLVAGVLIRIRAYLGEMGIDPGLATFLDGERYEGFFPTRGFLDRHAILTRDP